MTTPRLGAPELVTSQANKEETVNEAVRYVEAGAGHFIFIDRGLNTPPGSPVDGDCYLVGGSPTGVWASNANDIAVRINTAWAFINVIEGFTAWVNDENVLIGYDGAAWNTIAGYTAENARDDIAAMFAAGTHSGISFSYNDGSDSLSATVATTTTAVSSQSGTTYTAVLGDANTYIRFTNGSAISFTIPPNSSVAFPTGTVIEVEQGGAGALSFLAGAGVTLNSRAADLTLAGQYAVAFAKKVATDTWTVNGDL
jgi:hypothetical protein